MASPLSSPELSVVIPVYNEGANVGPRPKDIRCACVDVGDACGKRGLLAVKSHVL